MNFFVYSPTANSKQQKQDFHPRKALLFVVYQS